jgi:hypothetical protein
MPETVLSFQPKFRGKCCFGPSANTASTTDPTPKTGGCNSLLAIALSDYIIRNGFSFEALAGIGLMHAIRIPPEQWGKIWRVLIASGPISRLSQEPIYLVSDRQIRLLRRKKLPFELVPPRDGYRAGPTDG